jgi:cell division transport system ATP-binding protein
MNLFGQFSQVGVTVLIASHDITLIDDMNRRTLRLDQGQLVADGRPRTEVNRG